jgi:AraC-like DNA-binding protein
VEGSPRDYGISLDHVVKTQVAYRGNSNELRFPARLLCCPLKIAPDPGHEVLLRLNNRLSLKHRDTPIKERAQQVIFWGLSGGYVSQDQVASALAISSRTLRRKLAAENSSFQALLDECRMRAAALEFRIQPNQSLSGMALKLGYSEHSTFTRAFMRWSGMGPHEFRQTNSMAAAF